MSVKNHFPALALALSFISTASAQSVAVDSGHYYEGVPYNYVSTPPRAGTFYYNDFNRYAFRYADTNNRAQETRYFGGAGGTGSDKDYNAAAIIGQDRGVNGTFSGGITPNTYRRSTSILHNNPIDPGYEIAVAGSNLPAGTGHRVATNGTNNAIEFTSTDPRNPDYGSKGSVRHFNPRLRKHPTEF